MVKYLIEIAGLGKESKELRNSEILRSEDILSKIVSFLGNNLIK